MLDPGFAGTWETEWGTLELRVEGVRVTGTYDPNAGRVEGLAGGNTLHGQWVQHHVAGRGISWGRMTLTLAADRRSFTGSWSYGDDNAPGGGSWNGKRTIAPAR